MRAISQEPTMHRYVLPTLASSALGLGITLTQADLLLKVVASSIFVLTSIVGLIAAVRKLRRDK